MHVEYHAAESQFCVSRVSLRLREYAEVLTPVGTHAN